MSNTAQMSCPNCGYAYSKARSTRRHNDGSVRRDRLCLKCHGFFATFEVTARDHQILSDLRKWSSDDNRTITSARENAA